MAFNQNTGVYTPASGALTAAPGQVVQSAVWDAIFTDMTSAFTAAVQMTQGTYGQRNIIGMNGGFEVWQRGAGNSSSFSIGASSTAYTADRWYIFTNANQASTVAAVTGIVNGSRVAAKVQRNSGQTGTGLYNFGFPLDSDECAAIQGQIVALSFTAKAGANWSPSGGQLVAQLAAGTGTPTKLFGGGGYTNTTTPINGVVALTTTPTRFFFVSSAVPTTTTQAEVVIQWTPVGTAGADDSFTIDDVQLEILPNATSPIAGFERWPFELMRALCKRHYRKSFAYGVAPAQNAGLPGVATQVLAATVSSVFWVQFNNISMRATGAVTTFNPLANNANANSNSVASTIAVSTDGFGLNTADQIVIYATVSGASAGATAFIHWQADAGI